MLKINEITQLYLGIQGENRSREIRIDVNDWLVSHPNGSFSVWITRPGETIPQATGATFDADEGVIIWQPTSTDTYVAGEGEAEIRMTEGSVIKKTKRVRIGISGAVTGGGSVLGSDWQSYIDEVDRIKSLTVAASNTSVAASETAVQAKDDALAAQAEAEAARDAVEEARDAAQDAQTASERSALDAQTAQTAAEGSAQAAQTARAGAETARSESVAAAGNAAQSATAAAASASNAQESADDAAHNADRADQAARDARSGRQDIADDLAAARAAIASDRAGAQSAIATDKSNAESAIQAKGEQTLESIPEDYTNLSNQVIDLKSALSGGNTYESLRKKSNNDFDFEWAPVGLPTDEQTVEAVSAWLDDHPEATTTVDFKIVKKVFANVAEMYSDITLSNSDLCATLGYYSAGDGGGATYKVSTTEPSSYYEPLESGKYAELIEGKEVNYIMFGAKLNGINDDSDAVMAAHVFANAKRIPVRQSNGTIFLKTGTAIPVKTSTDLSGCDFILNDQIENVAVNDYFYVAQSDINENIPANDIVKSQLVKGKVYIPFLDDYPNSFIVIESDKLLGKRAYSDGGVTKYAPWYMSEVFTTGQGGYLLDGSLLYDYTDANTVTMHRYSSIDKAIEFKCPKYIVNRLDSTSMPSLLKVERSNVTVSGLTIKTESLGISDYKDFVGRVIYVNSFNCIFEKATGVNPTEKYTGTPPMRSGYCVQFEFASTGLVRNCNLSDNWGVINTQCVKNMSFRDSILNRIDNHWTMNNFDIDNVTISTTAVGIVLGHGDGVVNINNVTIIRDYKYFGSGDNVVVLTRADLGGTYEGQVNINNLSLQLSGYNGNTIAIFRHYSNIGTNNDFYKDEDVSKDVNITNCNVVCVDGGQLAGVICCQVYADGNPSEITMGNIRIYGLTSNANHVYYFTKGNTVVPVVGGMVFADMICIKNGQNTTVEDRKNVEITTSREALEMTKISSRQAGSFVFTIFNEQLMHNMNFAVETINSTGGSATVSDNLIKWTGCHGGTLIFDAVDFSDYASIAIKGRFTEKTAQTSATVYFAIKQGNSWNSTTLKTGPSILNIQENQEFDIKFDVSDVSQSGYLCIYSWVQEMNIESVIIYR